LAPFLFFLFSFLFVSHEDRELGPPLPPGPNLSTIFLTSRKVFYSVEALLREMRKAILLFSPGEGGSTSPSPLLLPRNNFRGEKLFWRLACRSLFFLERAFFLCPVTKRWLGRWLPFFLRCFRSPFAEFLKPAPFGVMTEKSRSPFFSVPFCVFSFQRNRTIASSFPWIEESLEDESPFLSFSSPFVLFLFRAHES